MKKVLWMTLIVVFSILFAFSASQAKPFKIAAIFQTAKALSFSPVSLKILGSTQIIHAACRLCCILCNAKVFFAGKIELGGNVLQTTIPQRSIRLFAPPAPTGHQGLFFRSAR